MARFLRGRLPRCSGFAGFMSEAVSLVEAREGVRVSSASGVIKGSVVGYLWIVGYEFAGRRVELKISALCPRRDKRVVPSTMIVYSGVMGESMGYDSRVALALLEGYVSFGGLAGFLMLPPESGPDLSYIWAVNTFYYGLAGLLDEVSPGEIARTAGARYVTSVLVSGLAGGMLFAENLARASGGREPLPIDEERFERYRGLALSEYLGIEESGG